VIPASASTDPTDRSMPPVRITKVMPMAIRPVIDDWRTIFQMLSGARKPGLRIEKATTNATRKISALNLPISPRRLARRRPASTAGAVTFSESSVIGRFTSSRRHHGHDLFRRRLIAHDLAHDPSLAHDQHPVTHAHHFGQFGGDHDDCYAFPGKLAHQGMNLGLRAHVN